MGENRKAKGLLSWIGVALLVALTASCVGYVASLMSQLEPAKGAPQPPAGAPFPSEPLLLTVAMMVAFALVVVLVILLLIFFRMTHTEDKTQALALPSGSVRALIAFALVLMFVCLGVYLQEAIANDGPEEAQKGVTQEALTALKAQFNRVYAVPATEPGPDKTPRFDVTYFPGRSKDADDLAKQMFTQLATVFVTVVGFYFGSSTAASGVGAGVAAAGRLTGKKTPDNAGVPGALAEAKAIAHDADAGIARITAALNKATDESKRSAIQSILDGAQSAMTDLHAKLQAATTAAAKFGTATSDEENGAAAADVLNARDAMKPLGATIQSAAAKAEATL